MKTKIQTAILGVALLVNSIPWSAQAQSGGSSGGGYLGFMSYKTSAKKASRWTLDEWLETRSRMKWSDMWLNFNSPSPYEFFLLGGYAPTTGKWMYGLGAYAQAIGLEFDQETVFDPAWNARINLRIFGVNVQNTNLTLFAGIRGRTNPDSYRQGYWGPSLTLYLTHLFGVYGQYRAYFTSTPSAAGAVSGHRFEAGPFIDFGPLRVYGYYLYETESADSATLGYSTNINYWNLGAQLFF